MAEHPIKAFLTERARSLGFDAIGFTTATLSNTERDRLNHFLAQNHHGSMGWMASRAAQRANPQTLWPEAVSLISLGLSYAPAENPLATLSLPDRGNISVYARNCDYHDIIKGKLKHLAQALIARAGGTVKVFVDTAPVMEKPLAQQAGLGWQGKHTNLVSRTHGSWLLLGEIMTTLALPPDPPHADRCGSCTACQTACPTNAFPTPYTRDATRCIAYLTIEHPGPIPHIFRRAIGNRIYGCDDCLAVCPWNKFATSAQTQKLAAITALGLVLRGNLPFALILALVLVLTLWLWQDWLPHLNSLRDSGNQTAFARGHRLSVWLNGAQLLAVLGVLVALARGLGKV